MLSHSFRSCMLACAVPLGFDLLAYTILQPNQVAPVTPAYKVPPRHFIEKRMYSLYQCQLMAISPYNLIATCPP